MSNYVTIKRQYDFHYMTTDTNVKLKVKTQQSCLIWKNQHELMTYFSLTDSIFYFSPLKSDRNKQERESLCGPFKSRNLNILSQVSCCYPYNDTLCLSSLSASCLRDARTLLHMQFICLFSLHRVFYCMTVPQSTSSVFIDMFIVSNSDIASRGPINVLWHIFS
jgi:hypothetical protein